MARRPGRTMGRLPGSSTSYRCPGTPTSTYLHSPPTTPRDHATRAHSSGKLPRVYKVDVPDGGPRPHTAATRPLNHNKLNPREGPGMGLGRNNCSRLGEGNTFLDMKNSLRGERLPGGGSLAHHATCGHVVCVVRKPPPGGTPAGNARVSHGMQLSRSPR